MTAHSGDSTFQRIFNRIVLGAIAVNTAILVWEGVDHLLPSIADDVWQIAWAIGCPPLELANLFGLHAAPPAPSEELAETLDYSLLWFFVFELTLRVRSAGRRFYRQGWLVFDIIVMVLALLPLGANVSALRVMRSARLLHFTRHSHHLPFTSTAMRRLTALRVGVLRWRRGWR